MCVAEKCCYCVPANFGCVLLGAGSFILSTFMLAASAACYVIVAKQEEEQVSAEKLHFAEAFGLDLNIPSVHILLTIAIIVAILWMIFSVMLVVGIIKNYPTFVLCYFSFGIIITILCQLSALLVLLHNCWIMAIVLFIASLVYIHFLVVVHTVYDLMQRGKDFRFHQHQEDEDMLADCFDEDTDIDGI